MRDAGARWTSVETALFELLKVAEKEPLLRSTGQFDKPI
jgi:hypothetical protein